MIQFGDQGGEKMEPKEKVVVFRGRKYYYREKFPETIEGRKGAKRRAEVLAKDMKAWTVVKKVPNIGFCVYVTKTMKRGG